MSSRRGRRNGHIGKLLIEREVYGRQVRGGAGTSAGTTIESALCRWTETDALRHCTAFYCTLQPEPRSTIAAAFSPDGSLLASTQCVVRLNYSHLSPPSPAGGAGEASRIGTDALYSFAAQRGPHGENHQLPHWKVCQDAPRSPEDALGGARPARFCKCPNRNCGLR